MDNKEWIAELTESDSDIWTTDIEGRTRKEVVETGMKYAKEEGLASFRIGTRVQATMPTVCIDHIIEDAYEQLYDEVGEVAEGFLDDATKEQREELEEKINEAFSQWMAKHKLEPSCYKVEDIEIIQVD